MRGNWNLCDWEYVHYSQILQNKIDEAYQNKDEPVSLVQYDLNPENVKDLLEFLGWVYDDFETNGWEQDCWMYFYNENYDTKLTVNSCGMTFDLSIAFYEE